MSCYTYKTLLGDTYILHTVRLLLIPLRCKTTGSSVMEFWLLSCLHLESLYYYLHFPLFFSEIFSVLSLCPPFGSCFWLFSAVELRRICWCVTISHLLLDMLSKSYQTIQTLLKIVLIFWYSLRLYFALYFELLLLTLVSCLKFLSDKTSN